MNRKRGIVVAGTLTALMLISILAMGFGKLQANTTGEDGAISPSSAELNLPQTGSMTNAEALKAWQTYSTDLENTVRTMQEREALYQQQLDVANQTILQMQDQINTANSGPAGFDNERFEHEHEEHEFEEHEFGEESD
jgi:hypothetical protein